MYYTKCLSHENGFRFILNIKHLGLCHYYIIQILKIFTCLLGHHVEPAVPGIFCGGQTVQSGTIAVFIELCFHLGNLYGFIEVVSFTPHKQTSELLKKNIDICNQ